MNKILKISIAALLFFSFSSCKEKIEPQKEAKYVFFLIGDGMGLSHRALTEMYLASLDDEIGQKSLLMNQLPVQGLATTYSNNSYITCSAASGTALATGKKTNNGMIGCSPDTVNYQNIAEAAKKAGKSVGILTNVMLNHATPAVFSAHAPSRNDTRVIRDGQLSSGFDYFAGGYMTVDSMTQQDKTDFLLQAQENGYHVFSSQNDLPKISEHEKVIFFADTLMKGGAMLYSIDYPKDKIGLKTLFEAGIEKLSANPNGFFIMLESGKIDWAAHGNDAATVVQEIIYFDEIIKTAFAFYEKHPDETLIVITADHETGGLALGNSNMGYKLKPNLLALQKGSVESIREDYQRFLSKYSQQDKKNDAPYTFLQKWFGFDSEDFSLNKQDSASIQTAWEKDITAAKRSSELVKEARKILAQKVGIGWTTGAHSGIPVPVSAVGAGAELFDGYYDNTDIPKKMAEAMGMETGQTH